MRRSASGAIDGSVGSACGCGYAEIDRRAVTWDATRSRYVRRRAQFVRRLGAVLKTVACML
jgi:hypothetical protein